MTNYASGHAAEKVATEYLAERGFKILDLNWKTRWCEIDIVAQKDKAAYFVEVKSRKDAAYGSGLEYITKRKLQQMQFAAELWVSNNNWLDDYRLAAIGIDGQDITFTDDLFL